MTKKKSTRKAVRYKVIHFKLTSRQKKSLDNYCRMRGTTTTKVIKKHIRPLLENYADAEIKTTIVRVHQLKLFNLEGQDP
jgi:predicted urease superfamily metal-dependent hydrolase